MEFKNKARIATMLATMSIILALFSLTAYAQTAEQNNLEPGISLQMTLLKYEPVPAHPGDSVDIWLKLDNLGGDVAKKVEMEFIDNYPFALESDSRKSHTLGALAGGYDYVAKFKARVDKQATIGQAFIKAKYNHGYGDGWIEALLPLDIESRITSLSVESIKTSPEIIAPGEKGILKIKVKNIADSKMRSVKAKLNLESSDAPVVPVDSSNELKIDELEPGEHHEFIFNIIAELDAEANAYGIPINLSFRDDTGDTHSSNELLGIMIRSEPDMVLTVDSSDVYTDDKSGTITLKFVNKGADEIKFVYIELLPTDNYELLSPTTKYYVGNIDTDDYEVEEITLKAKEDAKLEIPIAIEYRDASNKLYKTKETIVVNLVKKSELEEKKALTGKIIWALIILIVVGFYFWRKRNKKSKA